MKQRLVTSERQVRKGAALLLCLSLSATTALAQGPSRRLTNIDALRQFPGYFHLQSVLLRGEFDENGPLIVLRADDAEMRVQLEEGVNTRSGPVEVRGQLVDIGRLDPGDPRAGGFAEGRDADRWPRPGEELLIRVSGVSEAQPAATASIRALALEPWKFDGQKVTLVGNFRGRNLFGDLPGAPGMSPYDFILRSADAAIWVTGLRPRGRGFELDVNRRVDSDRWIEVTGTVVRGRGLVGVEATQIALAKAPAAQEATDEAAVPAVPLQPAEVIFSAPTEGETGVSTGAPVRIQFSRGIRDASLEGQIRVTYVGAPADAPSLAFTTSYDAGNRALEIRFTEPLERFSTVRVEILDGVMAFDGAPVLSWQLTFSVGD